MTPDDIAPARPLVFISADATTRDGRLLHATRCGEGTPLVVFEAGMGLSGNSWGAVVTEVARHTTAVIYDRSGLGRSAPDPARRDLARLAGDLSDLLDGLGAGPFILVGHSWGGPIVRCAAAERPGRIAGLVLVDQTDEGCNLVFSKAQERRQRTAPALLVLAARLGLLRAVVGRQAKRLPEPWASALRAEDGTASSVREQLAELRCSRDDLFRLRSYPFVLPDVPVSIISGAKIGVGERRWRGELIAAHRTRASTLPQGRHVLAEQSSHSVPFTQPDLVVAEIMRILNGA